ncbi:hypothetical protein GHT06_020394 [Daphnia sinensis]|uniref:Uncharacterized protein n=1 Tax=Daphnia sinensis TaxID=1820382 RepID=A0AAD5PMV6_9CRUS|nr:hypothetical protein GHT06_020394 [Daphnia sinensis]
MALPLTTSACVFRPCRTITSFMARVVTDPTFHWRSCYSKWTSASSPTSADCQALQFSRQLCYQLFTEVLEHCYHIRLVWGCWIRAMKTGMSVGAAAVMAATCSHLARPLIRKRIARNLSSAYSIPDSFGC